MPNLKNILPDAHAYQASIVSVRPPSLKTLMTYFLGYLPCGGCPLK